MKTKLLRIIRKRNPIYYDSLSGMYQYRTKYSKICLAGITLDVFRSECRIHENISDILSFRRECMLEDAKNYFKNKFFVYKRKRKSDIYIVTENS